MSTSAEQIEKILDSYIAATPAVEGVTVTASVRRAMPHIRSAMDAVHAIYLEQQSEEHAERIRRMQGGEGPMASFYRRFQGPWNPVEDYRSYDPEVPDRDERCSFYPHDMSGEEFRSFIAGLSEEERERYESPTTLIRRDEQGRLYPLPYHSAYDEKLAEAFDGLQRAADELEGEHESLAEYLRVRAEALVSGAYREADAHWVQLTGTPLEVVIGPYEVYSDSLLGRKATYEGMLLLVDEERCARLAEVERSVSTLAESFPLPAGSEAAMGGAAPMIVAHEIYNAGFAAQPIYPAAFNLPNDPWVRGNVGWKQVMIYNVMREKFSNVTMPIAERVLSDTEGVDFEPLFYVILLHEVSHGLGPAYRADGKSVDNSLGAHYTTLEEAKADAGGLHLLLTYGGTAGIPAFASDAVFKSYIAPLFRSMRFGVKEAHGAANVIEHNWLIDRGGLERTGRKYRVHPGKAAEAVEELLQELCRLQAQAGEQEAGEFIRRWGTPDEELEAVLRELDDFPIDLFLEFDLSAI